MIISREIFDLKDNHANIDLKFIFLLQLQDLKINPHRYKKDNNIHRSPLKPLSYSYIREN